jgi:ubiquinone/menaquinone biosynthesis C-methylase UbiE
MQLADVIEMISPIKERIFEGKQIWAELGCGTGTFTIALASLLQPESMIYAVDENKKSLLQIPDEHRSVGIEKHVMDFVKMDIPFRNLDGLLMANSLHYVKDKKNFLAKIIHCLRENACFLIVEYDTEIVVPAWVPYPVSMSSLKKLFADAGYNHFQKLNERKSVFGPMMYSVMISQ